MPEPRQVEIPTNRSFEIYKSGFATVSKPAGSTNGQTYIEYKSNEPLTYVAYLISSIEDNASLDALPVQALDVSDGTVLFSASASTGFNPLGPGGTQVPGSYLLYFNVDIPLTKPEYSRASTWVFRYYILRERIQ